MMMSNEKCIVNMQIASWCAVGAGLPAKVALDLATFAGKSAPTESRAHWHARDAGNEKARCRFAAAGFEVGRRSVRGGQRAIGL